MHPANASTCCMQELNALLLDDRCRPFHASCSLPTPPAYMPRLAVPRPPAAQELNALLFEELKLPTRGISKTRSGGLMSTDQQARLKRAAEHSC